MTDNHPSTVATDFVIIAIDAYHVVAGDQTYWQQFRASNRVETERFQLKPGWRTVYTRNVETVLVKVTLEDGTIGWGEATEQICPEVIAHLAANLLGPVLGGRPWQNPSEFWTAAYDLNRGRGHHSGYHLLAMAAVEVAVWDALGHRAGLPVARLLTQSPAESVDLYISGLRRGSVAERVEMLERLVDEGFAGAKIFVDGDIEATVAEIAALRAAAPSPVKLMVDALWSYPDIASAAEARRRLAEFDVNWLECPLVPEDFEAHVELARAPGTPVALGEHLFTHHASTRWLKSRVLEVFQPDICRTGFSDGWLQAGIARGSNIRVTPHMGSGSPVVQAAALNFAAACRAEEPCEYQLDLVGFMQDVFSSQWKPQRGRMPLCEAPGLGVAVNENALRSVSPTVEHWQAAGSDKGG